MSEKSTVYIQEANLKEKTDTLNVDEQFLADNLICLARTKKFRSAWNFLKNNAGSEHFRFYSAGVVLQHLSNMYGDIGELKDECILKKELDRHTQKVVELLL